MFHSKIDILKRDKYTKIIYNYVKILKIYKSAFNVLKFNYACNYKIDNNDKTT